ncbi:hypothetical protein EV421DRAFT_1795533 [Armillaria borealis]|uniref:Uncharacterized protein n=1 Tax=Armillaria borealis TaxID=47425 RepID=A0AA39JNJ5_9AGAR|nr:hypothetical protein EV421DRAFT_1795533 [Armillaria borealis]
MRIRAVLAHAPGALVVTAQCDLDLNLNLNLIVGEGFSYLSLMITDDGAIFLIERSMLYTQLLSLYRYWALFLSHTIVLTARS